MISPSIGRKVWYWPVNEPAMAQFNTELALDATVIYPWSDTCVNLSITDHTGVVHVRTSVFLHQGDIGGRPSSSCATWMPYQMGQAKAAA